MNFGEKIKSIMESNELSDKSRLKIYSTSSVDNHQTVSDFTFPASATKTLLDSILDDFEKYGNNEGSDPKGHWVKITDIELVN